MRLAMATLTTNVAILRLHLRVGLLNRAFSAGTAHSRDSFSILCEEAFESVDNASIPRRITNVSLRPNRVPHRMSLLDDQLPW